MQENFPRQQTVFIVNNDENTRSALYKTFTSSGFGVETFTDPTQFLNTYKDTLSGCIILDGITSEKIDLHIINQLRILLPHMPIILLENRQDISIATRVILLESFNILKKPFSASGPSARSSSLPYPKQATIDEQEQTAFTTHFSLLTRREKEILVLIVSGKASKVIAAELGISKNTVENHRKSIMAKLKTKSVVDLVREFTLHQKNIYAIENANQLQH